MGRAWSTRTVGGVVTVLVVTVAVVGCGDDGDDTSGAAPPDGAELYADNCASCHGDDLRGTSMGPSQLSIVYEPGHHPDDAFRSAVREGVPEHHWDFGPMPAVPGLDDDEITAIIGHIRSVQQREGFEPYPPG